MPMNQKIRTEEWLKNINAVDISERIIKAADYLDVKCSVCQSPGNIRAGNADTSFKTKGYGYCCHECKKNKLSNYAKERVGEKKHFYGKKHSEESKEKISTNTRKVWSGKSPEEKSANSKKATEAAYKKFNGNPMSNEQVKAKHHESTHSEEFIKKAKDRGELMSQEHNFKENMSHFSKEFWKTDEGEKQKNLNKERFLKGISKNEPWYIERQKGLRKHLDDPARIKEAWRKASITCLEKYGSPNWQNSKDADKRTKTFSSKAELEILEWVKSLGLDAKKHRSGGKEIDIYIESKKIGIEYNGLYWHSEVYKENNYHLDKTNYFRDKGIRIIHIFEHEWRDRKDQVKSFLKSALGQNKNKIGARKCELKEVDPTEAKTFLKTYHIQGTPVSLSNTFGLYYQGELLALANFNKHHRNKENWVLTRFVTKEDWTIQGGLSRLSKAGFDKFGKLISWADKRWSVGSGYESSGWKVEEILHPDYFYTDCESAIPKQSRKKDLVETPEGMTEREHAIIDGLFRIYDCGKIRYFYNKVG